MSCANLMLVGAPRAGTTWLFASLARNPQIYAPPVKEPHFHLADAWPLGGPEAQAFTRPLAQYLRGHRRKVWGGLMTDPRDYAALYAPGAAMPWRIEATPNYFAEGRAMAERLSSRLPPDTRVIVTLRDPVARALSHYRLFCQLGWETLPLDQAIAAGPGRVAQGWAPTWDYLRYSQIDAPLQDWRAVFGDRLTCVGQRALRLTPHQTIARLSGWLGLPDAGVAGLRAHEVNAAARGQAPDAQVAEQIIAATGRIDLVAERAALDRVQAADPPLPLVSVGMPVRNGAGSIGAALDSLRAQSYPNIEIVVCDNASTDGTDRLVQARAKADPRIRLARFENGVGIQDSYRRALDSRRGDYFLFAPADDTWHPGFVERAVHRMQHAADLAVCCGTITMHDDRGRSYPSRGTRPIGGTPQQRWRRGLLRVSDASRLYGLLRADRLEGIIPPADPQGWDHYTAAKLALRGPVARIDAPAMRRHQTSSARYRALIRQQEASALGRMGFARHVVALCRQDPEFDTRALAGRLALRAYWLKHAAMNLPGGRALAPLRPLVLALAYGLGALAWVLP